MNSSSLWIKFDIVCLIFAPLFTVAVAALLGRFMTMLNQTLQPRMSPVSRTPNESLMAVLRRREVR